MPVSRIKFRGFDESDDVSKVGLRVKPCAHDTPLPWMVRTLEPHTFLANLLFMELLSPDDISFVRLIDKCKHPANDIDLAIKSSYDLATRIGETKLQASWD